MRCVTPQTYLNRAADLWGFSLHKKKIRYIADTTASSCFETTGQVILYVNQASQLVVGRPAWIGAVAEGFSHCVVPWRHQLLEAFRRLIQDLSRVLIDSITDNITYEKGIKESRQPGN